MGAQMDRRTFRAQRTAPEQALFILPEEKLAPRDAAPLNVGLALAEAMKAVPAAERPALMKEKLAGLLPFGADVALYRADILFDPMWQADVLGVLLGIGRNRRLYLVWPGNICGTMLEYASADHADYMSVDASRYIDTYVVSK